MKKESAIENGVKVSENQSDFVAFKEKVRRLKEVESERLRNVTEGQGARTIHFQSVNPEELTEDDWKMYEKVTHYSDYGESLLEEFEGFQDSVLASGNNSRKTFASRFLANRLAALHGQAKLKEMREERKKK